MIDTNKEYLTCEEAAEFTRMSERTIRNYVYRNVIPYIKNGRKVLFKKVTLRVWLENGGASKYEECKKKKLY